MLTRACGVCEAATDIRLPMGSEAVSELNRLLRYLHNNCIEEIENLSHLKDLDTLNMEHNNITTIEGLSGCARLRTLNLAHNHLESLDDIEHLLECPSVSVLDLSHNKLDDPDILSTLEQMPNLSVLNLMGNDCVREIRNYRYACRVRSHCPQPCLNLWNDNQQNHDGSHPHLEVFG